MKHILFLLFSIPAFATIDDVASKLTNREDLKTLILLNNFNNYSRLNSISQQIALSAELNQLYKRSQSVIDQTPVTTFFDLFRVIQKKGNFEDRRLLKRVFNQKIESDSNFFVREEFKDNSDWEGKDLSSLSRYAEYQALKHLESESSANAKKSIQELLSENQNELQAVQKALEIYTKEIGANSSSKAAQDALRTINFKHFMLFVYLYNVVNKIYSPTFDLKPQFIINFINYFSETNSERKFFRNAYAKFISFEEALLEITAKKRVIENQKYEALNRNKAAQKNSSSRYALEEQLKKDNEATEKYFDQKLNPLNKEFAEKQEQLKSAKSYLEKGIEEYFALRNKEQTQNAPVIASTSEAIDITSDLDTKEKFKEIQQLIDERMTIADSVQTKYFSLQALEFIDAFTTLNRLKLTSQSQTDTKEIESVKNKAENVILKTNFGTVLEVAKAIRSDIADYGNMANEFREFSKIFSNKFTFEGNVFVKEGLRGINLKNSQALEKAYSARLEMIFARSRSGGKEKTIGEIFEEKREELERARSLLEEERSFPKQLKENIESDIQEKFEMLKEEIDSVDPIVWILMVYQNMTSQVETRQELKAHIKFDKFNYLERLCFENVIETIETTKKFGSHKDLSLNSIESDRTLYLNNFTKYITTYCSTHQSPIAQI